jgi:nucleotide-binding universal stress UspA family protein
MPDEMAHPPTPIRHVLVVFDGSSTARRALRQAIALCDEHEGELTVLTFVAHEIRSVGCCVPAVMWNRELDEMAAGDLAVARAMVGDHPGITSLEAVSGSGTVAVAREARRRDCDLILVPQHGPLRTRTARRLRRMVRGPVLLVRDSREAPDHNAHTIKERR